MKVNGYDIREYKFLSPPAIITYDLAFEQEQARLHAGLSREEYIALPGAPKWVDDTDPKQSKSEVLMAFRFSNLIRAVAEDAAARKQRRK